MNDETYKCGFNLFIYYESTGPQEIETTHLSPTTYKHIKRDHCIDDPCSFIEDTLLDPWAIVEDKTKKDRWIYHRDYEYGLYKVVVACIVDKKIKTAFISDEVKGGNVKWIQKGPLNK